jgi:16S rRNA (cytidine1402-2'-O)-methyltransferase
MAAWSAAGFSAPGFQFVGFLPAGKNALRDLDGPWPLIIYEAPHRVLATVTAMLAQFGPQRELAIAREISKKFEEIARMPLAQAPAWLAAGPHRQQGEFVLVLGPGEEKRVAGDGERVLGLLLDTLPAAEAAKLAAKITGAPRKELYALAVKRAK